MIPGKPASEYADTASILKELGRLAAIVHSIRTERYGHNFGWAGEEIESASSWRDFLERLRTRLDGSLELYAVGYGPGY